MVIRRSAQGLVVACILWASTIAHAAGRTEIINGGTCIQGQPVHGPHSQNISHHFYYLQLWGDKKFVFCHITMSDEWPANYLQFVILSLWPGQELKARLCVSSATMILSCGPEETFQGNYPTGLVVLPPTPLPPYPMGAYVSISNVGDVTSIIFDLSVYWERPWYSFKTNPGYLKWP